MTMIKTRGPEGGIWPTGQDVQNAAYRVPITWDENATPAATAPGPFDFDRYADGTYVDPKNDPPERVEANRIGFDRFEAKPLVEVTQADRDLVAFFHENAGYDGYAEHVRNSTNDDGDADNELQRVARHRLGI